MDDFRNFDPISEDFYTSVFVRRLGKFAEKLFEGKNYGDYSAEDLLSDTIELCWRKKWW
jgi:hypothetical protein